jgi:2-oxoisovalerate dehydrogenase E1 component
MMKKKPVAAKVAPAKRRKSLSLLDAYRQMLTARLTDEKTIILYKQNKCHFQIGVAGHEAVQIAAASCLDPKTDRFYPYYRDMALCLGLGMTPEELFMNAMNKAADPNSHGRMMPMHYGHRDLNIVQQSSPTGTQFLQAVGCALSLRIQKQPGIVYVSAGEGTCAQGDFHEALNWAARDRLPVIFLIQNNDYAISVHVSEQLAGKSAAKLAANYEGLAVDTVDGADYTASLKKLSSMIERIRSGKGPALLEADVVRLQSHSISDNHLKYRSAADIKKMNARCPLALAKAQLLNKKVVSAKALDELESEVRAAVNSAADLAEALPACDPSDALTFSFTNPTPWEGIEEVPAEGSEVFMVDALNHALDEELGRDPTSVVFGQDVAHGKGGVFTVTSGLTAKYGTTRVFNSQLAESSIAGVAIGLATHGTKAIAEIQFGDYVWTAMMQIRNELAMLSYRSRGDFTAPAVLRIPVGGYIHGGLYHSQNIEATFSHFPGIFVVYPSNATDAKGLLKAAIRGKDPVLFLEHKGLYRQVFAKGPEGGADDLVPLGKARIARSGDRATIVTWGALVHRSLQAAEAVSREGVEVEVIDLRSIVPLDSEAIFESVRKTGRLLIAHEDMVFAGFGAEIASQVSDTCFTFLDAPIRRVGMKYVAGVPHSPELEAVVLPNEHDVLAALRELLAF